MFSGTSSTIIIILLCLVCTVHCAVEEDGGGSTSDQVPYVSSNSSLFWVYLAIIAVLVLFAGLASGLTIGLMSLDLLNLRILENAGDSKEKSYAKKIIPLVEKHHLLLVTLLLANAVAMEALPIFLDRITSPIIAVLISVSLILLFGEVIPQALCTRYGLAIGANTAWLVKVLMVVLFPVAWPVSKLLDWLLGKDEKILFRRQELIELVSIHGEANHGPLTLDEITIIKGALDLKNKKVTHSMTPLDSVFMLPVEQKLDQATLKMIYNTGHSRIPVYKESRQNIIGLLFVKRLLLLDPHDELPLSALDLPPLPTVPATLELYDMLNEFQLGRSHMVAIQGEGREILGIVTLEDVIEELIQEEIIDETDVYVDVAKHIRAARMLKHLSTPNTQRKQKVEVVVDKPAGKEPQLSSQTENSSLLHTFQTSRMS